ncbi:MAG: hypothetical protein NTX23_02345 [Candidatus Bipolaricaulota bacterium]|nr:hypothetical protein [Candidatus Bipolaricaulota bacterium]
MRSTPVIGFVGFLESVGLSELAARYSKPAACSRAGPLVGCVESVASVGLMGLAQFVQLR